MKKTITLICLCLLVGAFAFMFVFSVFLPRTTVSNYSKLYEWPEFTMDSFLSGEYFTGIMYYFTDTIHGRDTFINFEMRIRDLYGIAEDETLIMLDPDGVTPEEDEVPQTSKPDNDVSNVVSDTEDVSIPSDTSNENSDIESSVPDTSNNVSDSETSKEEEQQMQEIESMLIIVGTRILEVYGGDRNGDTIRYAEILNNFADTVDPSVKVYSMVIPKASAYYLEQSDSSKYDKYIYTNKTDIEDIAAHLSDKVTDVNIYDILGRHANENIYYRTDHHWTAIGAYYASEVFANLAGVDIDALSEFREEKTEGFHGSLFGYAKLNPTILNNPEIFYVYYPDADYTVTYHSDGFDSSPRTNKGGDGGFIWDKNDKTTSWYSSFLRSDSYAVKAVSNSCKNGRKLLIVKDSYGNSLAPFMLEGFEEIYIVDGRYYNDSLVEAVEEFGITDVLFAECTYSATGNYINHLEEICK